jgi:hypothetical protein
MLLQKSLLYIWLLLGLQATAGAQWHLIKEGHGIKVYTANTGPTAYKSIKAVAVFNGTVEKFRAVLLDIAKQPQWVYGTRHAHLIKKMNKGELLYYVETALPWPADNRDAVIRMRIKENKAHNTITVTSVGEPQAFPVQNNKVRVPHFDARWEVKPAGENKISLTYLLDIDPGGSLPAWITNLFVSKGPYETFRNLSDQLKN